MQTLLYLKSILRQARQRNAENVFLTLHLYKQLLNIIKT